MTVRVISTEGELLWPYAAPAGAKGYAGGSVTLAESAPNSREFTCNGGSSGSVVGNVAGLALSYRNGGIIRSPPVP